MTSLAPVRRCAKLSVLLSGALLLAPSTFAATPATTPAATANGPSRPPSASNPTQPAGAADEAIEMDPFVISESDAVGYSANSTLAGTRINTALRDVGASISTVTPEFLRDTASTNLNELLPLTTGTEVGGVFGNFAGGAQIAGRPDQSEARENPQDNQRVRGIGPATNTRDFFITDIPFDSYNTSRVTISRGPNSLLFGIGNPAGIIDATINRPQLQRDRTEVGARYGSNDSYRGTLDLNRVLAKDRIALRVASVYEQSNYDQEPAFDRKRRVHAGLEVVLRDRRRLSPVGKTSVRVSGEFGDSRSTPLNVIPPINAFSLFFEPPDPAIDDLPGITLDPRVKQGDPAFMWAPRVTVDNRGSSANIPQISGGYYGVPYFIQIPLIYDTPGQSTPGFRNGNNPALAGLSGIMGRIRYAPNTNGRPAIDAVSTGNVYKLLTGFVASSLQSREIFDYRRRLISGASNRVEQNFQVGNVVLTQELFDGRGGLELAFDQQKTKSTRMLPFSFGENGGNGQTDIYIDVSQYLTNDQPNANVGRPFILQAGAQDRIQNRDRDAYRATAFYRLGLEERGTTLFGVPLGNHTLTGLWNRQQVDGFARSHQLGWGSDTRDLNQDVFQATISSGFRTAPVIVQYVGPSVLDAKSMNDVRITDVFSGRIPRDGEVHTVTFFDFTTRRLLTEPLRVIRFLNTGAQSRQQIDSQSVSLKSDFFRDTLVSVIGWRWDNLRTYSSEGNRRLPDDTLDLSSTRLKGAPDLDERTHNFTWSVVGRLPRRLSARLPFGTELSGFYNTSGNFNPVNVRTNLNGAIIPVPAGKTREYGALLELLDRRVSLRVNWFETEQTNSSNNAQGATSTVWSLSSSLVNQYRTAQTQGIAFNTIPGIAATGYSSYEQLYATFFQLLPEPTNTLRNLRFSPAGTLQFDGLQGLTDTSNLNARGLEAELVGNVTRHWRLSFNVAKQETVVDGSARLTKQVADALYANLAKFNLLGVDAAPSLPARTTIGAVFANQISSPLSSTVARDGTVSQEQRKWRANLVSAYDLGGFENPIVKRMSVGAAVRWQSKIAIGNPFLTGERLKARLVELGGNYTSAAQIRDNDPVMQTQIPDLARPFYGPEELAGDCWVGYRQRIFKRIDWRLQLNVRNAWGNRDDIPVTANPDGTLAIIRIPNETRWYLSSSFSF